MLDITKLSGHQESSAAGPEALLSMALPNPLALRWHPACTPLRLCPHAPTLTK